MERNEIPSIYNIFIVLACHYRVLIIQHLIDSLSFELNMDCIHCKYFFFKKILVVLERNKTILIPLHYSTMKYLQPELDNTYVVIHKL